MKAAIFATDLAGNFGTATGLPWPRLREDMQHFYKTTMLYQNMVMGSNTARILPVLEGRKRWVVTSKNEFDFEYDRAIHPSALNRLFQFDVDSAILIGGPQLLTPDLLEKCHEVYHTTVRGTFNKDVTVRIPPETLAWFRESGRTEEIILQTDNCIIRKWHV
jgi:dihydrofolate reductase